MYQKGGVGIPVVVAVVGGLVVLYVGYSFVSGFTSQEIPNQPINTTPQREQAPSEPTRAASVVSFDDNIFTDGADFYIRISDGYDENGNKTYSYIKADIADKKTFHKVPVLGGTETATKKGGTAGGTMPAFYMDSQHVYFFSGTSIDIVQGADPNTFQVLSPTYAKDANNVYVVNTTCDASGDCTGTITVIPGANPSTFETFHDTTVPDPDGSGTVVIDAQDDNNIYYYGIWVGPLPDPDDHSVHPETDNPVLISP